MKRTPRDAPIRIFQVLTSTNDSILEAGETDEPEGTTHLARSQTRGRGRGRHLWWSPPDAGLWMSTLLRPTRSRKLWGILALLAGRAARDALIALGVPGVELYWPNDLLVAGRKLGGILGEVRSRGERAWVALGIGINVDFRRPEVRDSLPAEIRRTATSLVECGAPSTTDPAEIARAVLDRFWVLYERFEGGEEVLGLLEGLVAHAGRRVTVQVAGRPPWTGTVEGLGPFGELLVRVEAPGPEGAGRAPGQGPPPGGDWSVGRPGVVAVVAGEVTYET